MFFYGNIIHAKINSNVIDQMAREFVKQEHKAHLRHSLEKLKKVKEVEEIVDNSSDACKCLQDQVEVLNN